VEPLSEYRLFGVYSMNKTGSEEFSVSTVYAASSVDRCATSSQFIVFTLKPSLTMGTEQQHEEIFVIPPFRFRIPVLPSHWLSIGHQFSS
jgi:hypothetical protein